MKTKTIGISIVIILLLTFSSLFLKIIPCKSWSTASPGTIGTFPHNTFCNLSPNSISYGPYNIYYYLTSSLTYAFLITLVIFAIIVFIISFILDKK